MKLIFTFWEKCKETFYSNRSNNIPVSTLLPCYFGWATSQTWNNIYYCRILVLRKHCSLMTNYKNLITVLLKIYFFLGIYQVSRLRSILYRGSEFSIYKFELWNRVTQNDVTLRVTNSRLKNENFYFELLARSRKNKMFYFELLTRWLIFYFFTLELLTQTWKTLNYYALGY